MKLSNFDWTDKSAVRWFILKSGEYEGPYDFYGLKERFDRKSNNGQFLVWAEGLKEALKFEDLDRAYFSLDEFQKLERISPAKIDLKIPLGSSKTPKEIPQKEKESYENKSSLNERLKWITRGMMFICILIFLIITGLNKAEIFTIKRLPKMSSVLHEKIQNQFEFKGWNQRIILKEFVPTDLSEIWLITEGFQECKMEAKFKSMEGKVISLSNPKIVFKAQGYLKDHVLKFSNYEFSSGKKILPGMYDVNLRGTDCRWGNFWAALANYFQGPEKEYAANLKLILFPDGPVAFNFALGNVLKKRMDLKQRILEKESFLWQDVILKYQTLLAITQQVEDHFLMFMNSSKGVNKISIKKMIDDYSKSQGYFLGQFVMDNEVYFKKIKKTETFDGPAYQNELRLSSKDIGYRSMKFIEKIQLLKNYSNSNLQLIKEEMQKDFQELSQKFSKRISELTSNLDQRQSEGQ